MKKIVSAEQAVGTIKDGTTLCISGSGGGVLEPDYLLQALESRFLGTGHPRELTIVHCASLGDCRERGINRLVHEGLVKRVIGGHWGWSPKMAEKALAGDIEAFNFPQGVISMLYREIAANRPGLITRTGLHTFADPRVDGGRLNTKTPGDYVSVIELDGEEYLFFRSFPIHCALLIGSFADEWGNVSFEREPAYLDALAMAMAVHNSGGIVIVQVKKILSAQELDARYVKIPGILVDRIVEYPEQQQTYEGEYNPAFSGEKRVPVESLEPLPLSERKVIARRAVLELEPGIIVNLGFGMPDGVASIAAEEGISDWLHFTVEQGPVDGVPASGAIFGVSTNPSAILDMPSNFDFYDGGGLDLTILSFFAQVDIEGNVNVSKFGNRLAGCGGFVNISQNAKRAVFVGTFTAGGLSLSIEMGRLRIVREGKFKKFLNSVEHITFSGRYAAQQRQRVLYVTERAVFELIDRQIVLTEIAAGIDVERDILAQMEFTPVLAKNPREMDPRLFRHNIMGLSEKKSP